MSKYNYKSKLNYSSNNFISIIDFYLFNCPVKFKNGNCVSLRADTFEKLGITGKKLTVLYNNIKQTMPKDRIIKIEAQDDLLDTYKKFENQFNDPNFEIVIFRYNTNLGVTKSLFYTIRNSLAHGSFQIKNNVYYFEDRNKNNFKSIIRLKENTLLQWIDLVHNYNSKFVKTA